MNVGIIGLGKLGLPIAVSIAEHGHDVMGYDLQDSRMSKESQPYKEAGPNGFGDFNVYLRMAHGLNFGSVEQVVDHADILFVAVQTPHDAQYEGITPMPEERIDFDYSFLCACIEDLEKCANKPVILTVISTCLPGTIRKHILPLIKDNSNISLVYNPFFIAMGSAMHDFTEPEFILMGVEKKSSKVIAAMKKFYRTIVGPHVPFCVMSIESAELTKVAYNTYITMKIGYTNTIMEICHKIDEADCDDVMGALKCATRRVISKAYLNGGMGDSGGCHPRDNIAMSSLARRFDLSYDFFESMMKCREQQAKWKAELVCELHRRTGLPILLLGYAFKPESNLIVGSAALLVKHYLKEMGLFVKKYDHHVEGKRRVLPEDFGPSIILLGCKHEEYAWVAYPEGSYVVDPFRMVGRVLGVEVIALGKVT